MKLLKRILFVGIIILFTQLLFAENGKVYLVIGSDTAIWDGLSTSHYHNHYSLGLYTDPNRNAYRVMDSDFRNQFVDYYGDPLRMTWWMMAGNIFRHATNTNVPIPNIMTLYLMKKYHGAAVEALGDELSLHYHTYVWTDYNQDGVYYWNEAHDFLESQDDFNFTLAQFLLEEQVFPVSFRSGWHYMDNHWQSYLNQILPYSLDNAYPSRKLTDDEPIDNVVDWSQAPSDWVPYHPSENNYQIPGNGAGWNTRCIYLSSILAAPEQMDSIFARASRGIDQVPCIWGHLPETDFLENIAAVDSLVHAVSARYPEVPFRYVTAVQAMQLWRGTQDTIPPNLQISTTGSGQNIYVDISVDEPIFQHKPFVAVKDIYERYRILQCEPTGTGTWQTTEPLDESILAKIGVTVTDTSGNQAMAFVKYLPDDIYVDDSDPGYQEIAGAWSDASDVSWGTTARVVNIGASDTVIARWYPDVQQDGDYNVFVQIPEVDQEAPIVAYILYANSVPVDTIRFQSQLQPHQWQYLSTVHWDANTDNFIELTAPTNGVQQNKYLAADVVKVSALVRDRYLKLNQDLLDFGAVSQDRQKTVNLTLSNRGISTLDISGIGSGTDEIQINTNFPTTISPMGSLSVPVSILSGTMGRLSDSLIIESNDPIHPRLVLPVIADVQPYFEVVDNDDSSHYAETGTWSTSVTQAYGSSSRYIFLQHGQLVGSAEFTTILNRGGVYSINEILPQTQNSSNYALYVIQIDGIPIDSLFCNQNEGSGQWKPLGNYYLPANINISVRVVDTGESTAGVVLRADAIKFGLIREISNLDKGDNVNLPTAFKLEQNYPNPFNPQTTIRYQLPRKSAIKLEIYDLKGSLVDVLVNETEPAGYYSVDWNARGVSSGIYFYRIIAGDFTVVKKLTVLK